MVTLRAVPRGFGQDGNALLGLYHGQLARHWPSGRLALAHLLSAAGFGGWSHGELCLLDDAVRRQGISMRDRKGVHRLLNPAAFPFAPNPLKNKRLFALEARTAGLPLPDGYDADGGDLDAWLEMQADIIAKPSYRSKGQGVERFVRRNGLWAGRGKDIAEADLIDRLQTLVRRDGVVQERVPTHAALAELSPGALPTLRVVTCLNEAGVPEACETALRLSAGGARPVDNFNAGNLVLAVDEAGRCGSAFLGGGAGRPARHHTHPATGATIAGTPVPDLEAAIALAERAHRHFQSGFTVIGWDVGLSARGPVLIEGNWNPGTDIIQLVTGRGLAERRLGALYRHHLAALPAQAWHKARLFDPEPRRS